jgi:S-adenosylmethionine:tRNA-ribosyltransferase-isomerase (queuine synthetase)
LVFKGNTAKFGSPLFVNKNKVLKRVVFEFADKSTMSLKMDQKRNRIVFDHLSPETPALTGLYSYYVPDFSYDAYVWEEDRFILNEDVIAINDAEDKESTIYVMDPKTGKVKKETYNGLIQKINSMTVILAMWPARQKQKIHPKRRIKIMKKLFPRKNGGTEEIRIT